MGILSCHLQLIYAGVHLKCVCKMMHSTVYSYTKLISMLCVMSGLWYPPPPGLLGLSDLRQQQKVNNFRHSHANIPGRSTLSSSLFTVSSRLMSLLLYQIYCLTLFLLGYIAVLEKDMNPKQSEKDLIDNLKSEIKIINSATEDPVSQVALQEYYSGRKHEGKEFLFQMLEDLSNGAFVYS